MSITSSKQMRNQNKYQAYVSVHSIDCWAERKVWTRLAILNARNVQRNSGQRLECNRCKQEREMRHASYGRMRKKNSFQVQWKLTFPRLPRRFFYSWVTTWLLRRAGARRLILIWNTLKRSLTVILSRRSRVLTRPFHHHQPSDTKQQQNSRRKFRVGKSFWHFFVSRQSELILFLFSVSTGLRCNRKIKQLALRISKFNSRLLV